VLGVRLWDKRLIVMNTKEHSEGAKLNNLRTERGTPALGPPRAAPREPQPQGPGGHLAPDRGRVPHAGL